MKQVLSQFKKVGFVALLALNAMGCSVQWREAESGLSSDEVIAAIERVAGASSSQQATTSTFRNLMNEPGSNIYFAQANAETGDQPMGPPWSIVSLLDFAPLGRPELGAMDLDEALVAFVENPERGEASLLVSFRAQGESSMTTRIFRSISAPRVVDGEYLADLDTILLTSFDVEPDEDLKPVIQLRAFILDERGNEISIGKFSTLVGYSR